MFRYLPKGGPDAGVVRQHVIADAPPRRWFRILSILLAMWLLASGRVLGKAASVAAKMKQGRMKVLLP